MVADFIAIKKIFGDYNNLLASYKEFYDLASGNQSVLLDLSTELGALMKTDAGLSPLLNKD